MCLSRVLLVTMVILNSLYLLTMLVTSQLQEISQDLLI